MALQAQQDENDRLRAQLAARNQPPQEPEPELPGAGEPPSEPTTEAGSVEEINDDSDAETLGFNETDDRSDHPNQTDNDPYEEAQPSEMKKNWGPKIQKVPKQR